MLNLQQKEIVMYGTKPKNKKKVKKTKRKGKY